MNRERLLKLATFLEELPESNFDFSSWIDPSWDGVSELRPGCGTTACALGWATNIPEFGLRLAVPRTSQYGSVELISGQSRDPIKCACVVFDLTDAEATLLFTPQDYDDDEDYDDRLPRNVSAKEVAQHIRDFCA